MKPSKLTTVDLPPTEDLAASDADAMSEHLLAKALQQWQAAMDAGQPLKRDEFLDEYDAVRDELSGCLDGMNLLQKVAQHVEGDSTASAATITGATNVGDFRILREIGRGGMGVVYEAQQLSLHRKVALKVLPFAAVLDKRALVRFQNEARAAATLEHPNIVPVYAVGEERGVHFYAMRLIQGQSLAEAIAQLRGQEEFVVRDSSFIAEEPLSTNDEHRTKNDTTNALAFSTQRSLDRRRYFQTVAELAIQIADALHHAHENGIVHRDVKPGNILIDNERKAWITDFGLARLETDAAVTLTGDIVGTLRYMAPEQADPKGIVTDQRADVYSLGITLYEALTTKRAFPQDDKRLLLRHIVEDEPPHPRHLRREIPQDLETIVLKAIEKEPDQRYLSAKDFADDLRSFINSKPIRARRLSLPGRMLKFSRRHPWTLIGAAITSVILLAVVSVAFYFVTRAQQKTTTALQQKAAALQQEAAALDKAEQSLDVAREAVDDLYIDLASSWLADTSKFSEVQRKFLKRQVVVNFSNACMRGRGRG